MPLGYDVCSRFCHFLSMMGIVSLVSMLWVDAQCP